MYDDVDEAVNMVTPFEESVLESFSDALLASDVKKEVVDQLEDYFLAEKLPTADALLQRFKEQSREVES